MLSIIVAKAKNNIIGKDDKKPWKILEDDKKFDALTKGHVLIMGRKTYDSLEEVLPERTYVVMTENKDLRINKENVVIVHSMLEIQQYIEDENENFVIGGAMIYNLLLKHVNKLYVTEIDKPFEGNAFFPKINLDIWEETSRESHEESGLKFDFVEYKRK